MEETPAVLPSDVEVDDRLLAEKLEELDRLLPGSRELRTLLETFVRTASDADLCASTQSGSRRVTAATKRH